jgi:glyceraldehyde-3-phosphate dehydrogenase/erythrose-4-phosphate dehydrogenase
LAEKDPAKLPWKDLGIDIVLECTGIFTDKAQAQVHLDAGAKRVLVSAPSKGADLTVVYGVNHDKLTAEHRIVSNASCTTNFAIAKVLNDRSASSGFMTTIAFLLTSILDGRTGHARARRGALHDPHIGRAAAPSGWCCETSSSTRRSFASRKCLGGGRIHSGREGG